MNPNNLQQGQEQQAQPEQGGNPFDSIVSQFAAQHNQQPQQGMGMEQSMPQEAPQGPVQGQVPVQGGVAAGMEEDPLQKGVNPGTSKFLVGAIQQMHNFIAESQDRDEIAIGRSIIQLLSRLIQQDQENQASRL